jgi:integrase
MGYARGAGRESKGDAMSKPAVPAAPRRTRVERNIYRRRDGKLEIGFRDSAGKQRWRVPNYPAAFDTITEARNARLAVLGLKAGGEQVKPSPKLRFGDASERWLAEQVSQLRPATQAIYRNAVVNHLGPRWGRRRLDAIGVDDAATLVRELRAEGLSEWTIAGILKVASRVFKFARRRCGWSGESPISLLESGERPNVSGTPERRIYSPAELASTLAASEQPWRTLFRLAAVVGGRESELLGLRWENVDLSDLDAATIRFTHQVDRKGERVALKTEESKATLPLPRSAALMLAEHKAASLHSGPRAFVFATRSGRPLGQRNVLRALHRAQEKARDAHGLPTFPELFEHDEHGHPRVDARGRFVPRRVPRKQLSSLPDFHALRHGAAMDCDDAEEARDLLRHRNSNVTRTIYRAHFDDRRREALRARMEARHAAASVSPEPVPEVPEAAGEVVNLQRRQARP